MLLKFIPLITTTNWQMFVETLRKQDMICYINYVNSTQLKWKLIEYKGTLFNSIK